MSGATFSWSAVVMQVHRSVARSMAGLLSPRSRLTRRFLPLADLQARGPDRCPLSGGLSLLLGSARFSGGRA